MIAEPTPTTAPDLERWLDRVVKGDVFATLRDMPPSCATLAIVDGPYNMRKADWDKFSSWEAFREFYAPLWAELDRVLRDNCSLYVFGTFESLAALKPDLDGLGKGWQYRQTCTWDKGIGAIAGRAGDTLRMYPQRTEFCLFYARERVDIGALAWGEVCGDHGVGANGVPLHGNTVREYLESERQRAGVSHRDVIAHLGMTGHDSHFFSPVQWKLPLPHQYAAMRELFNSRGNGSGPYLRREYEYLRSEYEDLRSEYEDLQAEYRDLRASMEDLRYPFNPQVGVTDVWEVPICAGAERIKLNGETAHVAQKPLAIMRRIVQASSNEGDTVLVPFSGVGSAEVACVEAGRRFVGIEQDAGYVDIAAARRALQPALALETT